LFLIHYQQIGGEIKKGFVDTDAFLSNANPFLGFI
jgi:hypothetical protein